MLKREQMYEETSGGRIEVIGQHRRQNGLGDGFPLPLGENMEREERRHEEWLCVEPQHRGILQKFYHLIITST